MLYVVIGVLGPETPENKRAFDKDSSKIFHIVAVIL